MQREIEAMKNMQIEELKTIGEDTPIQDSREIESLEKSLDIEEEAAEIGQAPEAAGLGGAPGGGGAMGMEGDMEGEINQLIAEANIARSEREMEEISEPGSLPLSDYEKKRGY